MSKGDLNAVTNNQERKKLLADLNEQLKQLQKLIQKQMEAEALSLCFSKQRDGLVREPGLIPLR